MYHTHTHKDYAPVCVCVFLFSFFFIIKVSLITQSESLSLSTRFCVRLFRAEDKHGRTELAAFSTPFIPRSGKHRKSLADVDRDVISTELVVVVVFF